MKTWYQTIYALTKGIIDIGNIKSQGKGYIEHGKYGFDQIGIDIFPTMEEAKTDQQERARKAIAAAEKKIEKLKKLL